MPGHEAVLVFFVLSGFVLMVQMMGQTQSAANILAYYGRRILRLYLPVWGAIIFALILAELVKRDPSIGSSWLATHKPPTVSAIAHDLVLILGTSNLDSPLWSLTWEVWFSLLLPLLYLLFRVARVHDWWIPALALFVAVSAFSRFPFVVHALPLSFLSGGFLQYMPVFAIGMTLASRRDTLTELAGKIRAWWLVLIVALLALISPTIPVPNNPAYGSFDAVLAIISLAGVTTVVFVALEGPSVRSVLERRTVQWAGTRSFSIYLIHEPILVAAALLTRADSWFPWLFIAAALIPVILFAAEGFYRVVEHPAHGIARRTGRAIQAALERRKAPAVIR
jgi:peptidoglycan/LPS O-acetylase OafA/YrhL